MKIYTRWTKRASARSRGRNPSIHDSTLERYPLWVMNCPQCESTMRPGIAELRGTVAFLLPRGGGYQELWWRTDGEESMIVLDSRTTTEALRCSDCGTLVVPPAPPMNPPNELSETVSGNGSARPGHERSRPFKSRLQRTVRRSAASGR